MRQIFFLAPLFVAVAETAAADAFVAGATAAVAVHGSHWWKQKYMSEMEKEVKGMGWFVAGFLSTTAVLGLGDW